MSTDDAELCAYYDERAERELASLLTALDAAAEGDPEREGDA